LISDFLGIVNRRWHQADRMVSASTSTRAWLFRAARNMIIDERRSVRFRSEVSSPDGSDEFEHCGPDEVNAAPDRLLIADALMHLSPEHRAVVRSSYFLGWTIAQIADDLQIAEGTVIAAASCAARPAAYGARNGRHPMTRGRGTGHGVVDHRITHAAPKDASRPRLCRSGCPLRRRRAFEPSGVSCTLGVL
jgi:RNA polymerase sigma factor (sigma-70 family)